MDKLIIEINSKNWHFSYALDEIKTKLENWFMSWFDENKGENYFFNIN
jgi:hypothetical protein